eukprot:RCo044367
MECWPTKSSSLPHGESFISGGSQNGGEGDKADSVPGQLARHLLGVGEVAPQVRPHRPGERCTAGVIDDRDLREGGRGQGGVQCGVQYAVVHGQPAQQQPSGAIPEELQEGLPLLDRQHVRGGVEVLVLVRARQHLRAGPVQLAPSAPCQPSLGGTLGVREGPKAVDRGVEAFEDDMDIVGVLSACLLQGLLHGVHQVSTGRALHAVRREGPGLSLAVLARVERDVVFGMVVPGRDDRGPNLGGLLDKPDNLHGHTGPSKHSEGAAVLNKGMGLYEVVLHVNHDQNVRLRHRGHGVIERRAVLLQLRDVIRPWGNCRSGLVGVVVLKKLKDVLELLVSEASRGGAGGGLRLNLLQRLLEKLNTVLRRVRGLHLIG